MPSGENTPGASDRSASVDENAARELEERRLLKEAEAERLLDEWMTKESFPTGPIDPVVQANTIRRIKAHMSQAADRHEEWERIFAYESFAVNPPVSDPPLEGTDRASRSNDKEETK